MARAVVVHHRGWLALHQRFRYGEVGRGALHGEADQAFHTRSDVDAGQAQQRNELPLWLRVARFDDVNGHRLIQHDGVDFAFTNRFARYVDDAISIIVFINLGEDDEAAMPKRITDNVAAIYLPRLNNAEDKANAHVEAPSIGARQKDVSTLEAVIDASLKALSGPVGAPRDWDRYQHLFDPAARLVSTSINDKGETVITRWNLESYKTDADDYLVKTGFEDRKLACLPTRFGNVAAVRCSFEGLEQSKIVERGVAMYQLYNDGKRWWITSVVWDRETAGEPDPPEFLQKK